MEIFGFVMNLPKHFLWQIFFGRTLIAIVVPKSQQRKK
jgi:hypothetical protein